jgi:hypothetical protein
MIRSLTRPLFLAAVVSTSLFAAACSDDPSREGLTFSTLDAAHLERALDLTAGRDLSMLYVTGLFVSGANEPAPACPVFVSTGNVTTVTGGCTSDDGARFEGRIVITNMPALFGESPTYDPTQPSVIEAIDWKATDADGLVQGIDGKLTATGDADSAVSMTGAVDATLDGITAHLEMSTSCDDADRCTMADGSFFEIEGLGAATLSGSYGFADPPSGAITATGAETLVLDVAAGTDTCRTYRIGSAAPVQLCEEEQPSGKRMLGSRFGNRASSWL